MRLPFLTIAMVALIISLFPSCKSKGYAPLEYEKRQLIFGSGGGFTGKVNSYALLENGRIYRKLPFEKEYIKFSKLPSRTAKGLFEEAESLEVKTLKFQHPGDLYHFLTYRLNPAKNKVSWGDERYTVDRSIEQFYAKLMRHIYNSQ